MPPESEEAAPAFQHVYCPAGDHHRCPFSTGEDIRRANLARHLRRKHPLLVFVDTKADEREAAPRSARPVCRRRASSAPPSRQDRLLSIATMMPAA